MNRPGWRKRLFDLALAVPGLLAAAPIILAGMAAVKLTSPGPAIFAQTRVGRGEASFRCYKLRTMFTTTPDLPTHEVARTSITPAGNFLRRFKIDELPQLWNVVRGEMSLVGPRPCLPTQQALIEARRRLGVFEARPGVTGLAQVRGIDMSTPQLLAETDAAYVAGASVSGDITIILSTLIPGRAWRARRDHHG